MTKKTNISPLLAETANLPHTPEVERVRAAEIRKIYDESRLTPARSSTKIYRSPILDELPSRHRWAEPETWETGILALVRIILAIMAAAGLLWVSGQHLVASVVHAAEMEADPCYSADGFTPDNEEACTAFWDEKKKPTGREIEFFAPRGFPCNPEHGACFDFYHYKTTPEKATGIIFQAIKFQFDRLFGSN